MKINRRDATVLFIYFGILFNKAILFSAEQEQKNRIVIIAVPGILAGDMDRGYSENILKLIPPNYSIHRTGTIPLADKPDLSQERCLDHLRQAIDPYKNNKLLFISTSQGSGTTTNYLAKMSIEKIDYTDVKAVICEGYPASFNQCVTHAIECDVPFTQSLPFKYYWLPYLTKYYPYFYKTFFPFIYYNPAKKQPFENLKHLPKNLSVIIIHCKQDQVTPYDGAEIAYHKLVSSGHDKTYLISVPQSASALLDINDTHHINVIADESQQQRDIQAILVALLNEKEIPQDIASRYQPNIKSFKVKTDELKKKENLIKRFGLLFTALKYCTFLYIIVWKTRLSFLKSTPASLSSSSIKKVTFFEDPFFLL